VPALAGSCTGAPLAAQLAAAVRGGASLIVAAGTLTGTSVAGKPVAGKPATGDQATAGATAFYAMALTSVRTLRGPAIASGSTAWIPGPVPGPNFGGTHQAAENGLYTVPLATVERLAASAEGTPGPARVVGYQALLICLSGACQASFS